MSVRVGISGSQIEIIKRFEEKQKFVISLRILGAQATANPISLLEYELFLKDFPNLVSGLQNNKTDIPISVIYSTYRGLANFPTNLDDRRIGEITAIATSLYRIQTLIEATNDIVNQSPRYHFVGNTSEQRVRETQDRVLKDKEKLISAYKECSQDTQKNKECVYPPDVSKFDYYYRAALPIPKAALSSTRLVNKLSAEQDKVKKAIKWPGHYHDGEPTEQGEKWIDYSIKLNECVKAFKSGAAELDIRQILEYWVQRIFRQRIEYDQEGGFSNADIAKITNDELAQSGVNPVIVLTGGQDLNDTILETFPGCGCLDSPLGNTGCL